MVSGCATCDDNDDPPNTGDWNADAGSGEFDAHAGGGLDAGSSTNDAGDPDPLADAGSTDSGEADSGAFDSGAFDSGSGDTGNDSGPDMPSDRCGDGSVQAGETCDDGVTTDCATTHDGGDGTCVAAGTCVAGYSLDAAGTCVPNATGLSTPCSNGAGQTLFRFHYDNGSTSARIDVWDAACSYSFANQACNVREVYPGFGDLDRTSGGFPVCTSSEYIRVRYSVAGIPFTRATLYVQARSYSTGSSTSIEAWSPIYGSQISGLVDNDFVYDWYTIDWSNHLSASDDPNLTAIQLYAYQGSNRLAVEAVELCLE